MIDLEEEEETYISSEYYWQKHIFEYQNEYYFIGRFGEYTGDCEDLPDLIKIDLQTFEETLIVEDLPFDCSRNHLFYGGLVPWVYVSGVTTHDTPVKMALKENKLYVEYQDRMVMIDMDNPSDVKLKMYDSGERLDYFINN